MARLSKSELKQKSKVRTVEVTIESTGGEVLIKSLSGAAAVKLNDFVVNGKPGPEYMPNLIAVSIVDDDGSPVYTVEEASEIDAVVLTELELAIHKVNDTDKILEKAQQALKNR